MSARDSTLSTTFFLIFNSSSFLKRRAFNQADSLSVKLQKVSVLLVNRSRATIEVRAKIEPSFTVYLHRILLPTLHLITRLSEFLGAAVNIQELDLFAVKLSNLEKNMGEALATTAYSLKDKQSFVNADIEDEESDDISDNRRGNKARNLIAFWLLGLCNNYAYVVMLSAAVDIIDKFNNHNETVVPVCTPQSAGAILLADIFPALLIKLCGPFINANTHLLVAIVTLMSAGSFILTSLSPAKWLAFVGVVAASLSSGLGEITFLKYSSHYHKNIVSAWSSGTGGAGVLGATLYCGITFVLSPEATLLVMLIIPILLAISFWIILEHPRQSIESGNPLGIYSAASGAGCCGSRAAPRGPTFSLAQKIKLIKPLLKYMIPLGLVYFAEYFINQGLTELITFENSLTLKSQYRLYQVCYQVGVLISRSSVNVYQINKLWVLPILQLINVVLFTCEAIYRFVPSIIIVAIFIVIEGLFGGASYVNTFFKVSQEIAPEAREFSMGVTSLSDSLGITLAAFIAIKAHNLICDYRNSY
ncbi:battenin-like isoform X3 [Varroa jacobsoni]|uniref:battenin-like isoform X3 n=1 Tax=Varroa jacobsoni TaxID=62625 RepID=UPI000BFAAB34|nr:battenin-like isoform X3 [Varroa jacobsoni]